MFSQRNSIRLLLYWTMVPAAMVLTAGISGAAPPKASAQVAPSTAGQRAEIFLSVPLDAIVWVNGIRTSSVGITRTFVTPPLPPGRKYGYDFRISWIEGGRAREIERHVIFRPGDRLTLRFAQPNWTETARDLYLDPAAPAPWGTRYNWDPLNAPNYPNFLFPGAILRPR